jgi:[ribosomal protein S5]-alanine N-acetyltransferase
VFPSQITTDRLFLRPPTEADAELVFSRYGRDPEVCRFLSWGPHRSLADTHDYLERCIRDNEAGATVSYLIFARVSNELLGSVGGRISAPLIQWGYCLARDAWGRGFATEAARAFVEVAKTNRQSGVYRRFAIWKTAPPHGCWRKPA